MQCLKYSEQHKKPELIGQCGDKMFEKIKEIQSGVNKLCYKCSVQKGQNYMTENSWENMVKTSVIISFFIDPHLKCADG